jgi:hypothetical protein
VPRPWWDPIKATKTLTIFPGQSITGSSWAAIFNNAVSEFNRLSAANALGVTYQPSSTPPEAHGPGGANVSIEAYDGTFTFVAAGGKIPVTVDGNGHEAKTQPLATDEPAQAIS